MRTVVESLRAIGIDLSTNPHIVNGDIALENLPGLSHEDLRDGWESNLWLQALRLQGVYFSSPIDIDFSMLAAFPGAYQHPRSGGRGPRNGAAALEQQKAATLKTGGDPNIFDTTYDDVFRWYPYLFLDRSKPETHLAALNRISPSDLAEGTPPELRALIEHVKVALKLGDAAE